MKKVIYILLPVAVIIIGAWLFISQGDNKTQVSQQKTEQLLTPASSFDHAHGIAVDRSDPNNVYIATHEGLYLFETGSSTQLFTVGNSRNDLMGFSAHASDPKIFYSSGHPVTGGNIGFQKTEDGGRSWQKISDGLEGPVDFHSMTVSVVNPDLVFGSYHGKLQRSQDGGKSWEALSLPFVPIGFTTTKQSADLIYGASPQGAFKSEDMGQTWKALEDFTKTGSVSAIAISGKTIVLYTEKIGMAYTDDSGQFVPAQINLNGDTPLYADFSPSQENIGYLITNTHSIYKTEDSGKSWNEVKLH